MDAKAGGRGGIDAAIYLTNCTPEAELTLLADLFSITMATATIAKTIEDGSRTQEREALAQHAAAISAPPRKGFFSGQCPTSPAHPGKRFDRPRSGQLTQ